MLSHSLDDELLNCVYLNFPRLLFLWKFIALVEPFSYHKVPPSRAFSKIHQSETISVRRATTIRIEEQFTRCKWWQMMQTSSETILPAKDEKKYSRRHWKHTWESLRILWWSKWNLLPPISSIMALPRLSQLHKKYFEAFSMICFDELVIEVSLKVILEIF